MKKTLLVMMAVIAVSCGLEEVSRRVQGGAGDVWTGPGMNTGSGDRKVVYVTGFDYPDGYDWRADVEKGSVKCSLVVYADGVPMMKVPVGDKYETGADMDMHRMVKGHLYTDYSSDSETVIKKDGKELIRYAGREMICALVEKDGDVYTLGHDRSGDGFSYRKNGEVILKREYGSSFGGLYEDGEDICFAFWEPVEAETGTAFERYYYSVGGEVRQTAVREDVKKVWDVVYHNGEVYYLASVVGISFPVLFCDSRMQVMITPKSSRMLTCRILRSDGALYVEGLCERVGMPLTSGLWKASGQSFLFADGMTVSSACMDGDGICCALNGSSPLMDGVIYRFGETIPMPSGYASIGNNTSVIVNGILHVGLSSLTDAPPLIWKDGETIPLKINGFISSVSTSD